MGAAHRKRTRVGPNCRDPAIANRQLASMRKLSYFASLATLFSGGGGVFYRSAAYPSVAVAFL